MTLGVRPKISDFGFEISDFQKSTVACATRATFAKVKSSAMTARQPSVPNLMGFISRFSRSRMTKLFQFPPQRQPIKPVVFTLRRFFDGQPRLKFFGFARQRVIQQ